MKKKLQIFVSSTFKDLQEERQVAVETILKSKNIPAGMELFTSGDQAQLDVIKNWIYDSDIYMLILGGRYGSIEPISGKSYTEVEYDYAASINKPFFSIVIDDNYLEEKEKRLGAEVKEKANIQKYNDFKNKVLSKTSCFFKKPDEIVIKIYDTLDAFKQKYNFTGWVSGKEVENNTELLEENRMMQKELTELKNKSVIENKDRDENEFEEIHSVFSATIIKYKHYENDLYSPGTDMQATISKFIEFNSNSMLTGITNGVGSAKFHLTLYFQVMPKLEIHGLATLNINPAGGVGRYSLTQKGKNYLAYFQKKNNKKEK